MASSYEFLKLVIEWGVEYGQLTLPLKVTSHLLKRRKLFPSHIGSVDLGCGTVTFDDPTGILVRQTRQQQVELTPLHYVNGQRIMTSELVSPIQALAQGNSAATGDGSAATLFGHIERQTSREYHMHSGSNQSPETLPKSNVMVANWDGGTPLGFFSMSCSSCGSRTTSN